MLINGQLNCNSDSDESSVCHACCDVAFVDEFYSVMNNVKCILQFSMTQGFFLLYRENSLAARRLFNATGLRMVDT